MSTKPLASQVRYVEPLGAETTVQAKLNTIGKQADKAILSFPSLASAEAAAATLPDGQEVRVSGSAEIYEVSSEGLSLRVFPLRLGHTPTIDGYANDAYKAQIESDHIGSMRSVFHVEGQSLGSGATGPNNADYGATIAIHKKDYAGANPLAGEIDGLSIVVRQDGPKGQAAGSPGSSDASAILLNIQNVNDCGFTSAWEATTSNYNTLTAAIARSIQTQIGVLDMNRAGAPGYGFVAVSTRGVNDHAFYAANGLSNGGTWKNVLYAPNMVRIDATGNYYAPTADWTNGAWSVVRATGANGSTQVTHRGTGALLLLAQDAGAIVFGTNNAMRWEITSSGTLRPTSANTSGDMGDPNRRVTVWPKSIDFSPPGESGQTFTSGVGSPEGVVAARVGSLYTRRDGGPGSTLYVKEAGGIGNTGWAAK